MQPIDGDAQYLHRKLQEFGIHIEGKTPDLSTEEIRQKRIFSHVKAKEILAWLTIHTEVTHYVVLDDLNFHNEEIWAHLVKTDPKIWHTAADCEAVIEKFR